MSELIDLIKQVKEAQDLQANAWNEYKKTNDELVAAKADGKAIGEFEAKLAKMQDDLNKAEELKAKVAQLEVAAARADNLNGGEGKGLTEEQIKQKEALLKYARTGDDRELKDLSVSKDANGGYFVTPDMSGAMVDIIFETSPVRSVASVQSISTDSLQGMYDDDEAAAGWTGELTSRATTDTPDVGQWDIPVNEMYAKPKATQKLLEDSSIDIESWLTGKIGEKFARLEATAFVTGDGAHKPKGFLSYAASSTADVYERETIGQVAGVGAIAGALSFDDIYNLSYALKAGYRMAPGTRFAMNRSTFAAVRKLKDQNDNYLWEPSNQVGQPATLNGIPTIEFNDMPDVADGSLSIALADWSRAYQIVDRISFSLLVDPYSAKPFVEFYARRRVGGQVVNFDAIKLLKTKTS